MTPEEIEKANLEKQADAKVAPKEGKTDAELVAEAAAVEAAKQKAEQESIYKKELERLEMESKQKADALTVERSRRKKAEEEADAAKTALEAKEKDTKALSVEEMEKLLEEKLLKRDFEFAVKGVTSDTDEQNLIKYHYNNSIKQTGNVSEDLKKAVAIANQHLVDQAKQAQIEREGAEARMTGFQSGHPTGRQGKPAYESDPKLRDAASLLDKIGMGEAKKFLK